MSKTKWVRWIAIRAAHPLDVRLRGTKLAPSTILGAPLCYLTTTGRKSGEPREVPLLFLQVDDGHAVVASNYGQDHHPAWSYNLDADPHATLEIDGRRTDVIARQLTDDERNDLWPRFERVWPGYEEYQRISPRNIKMYLLEPAIPESGTAS